MALEFFYRRQKLVIGIMVVLMVAFLIPYGISNVMRPNPAKQVLGTANGGEKITLGMQWQAKADLEMLGNLPAMPWQYVELMRYFNATNERDSQPLAWALLVQEADRNGVKVYDRQVEQFLSVLKPEQKQKMLNNINSGGGSEKALNAAILNLIKIKQSFDLADVQTPPALPEVARAFRNANERIELNLVDFPLDKFIPATPPTQEDLDKQFNQFKDVAPGSGTFGFGYRLGDRADVAWMFFDRQSLAETVNPAREEMYNYFMEHGRELKPLEVLENPASSSAPTSSSAPAEPPKMKRVPPKNFSDAEPQIRQILKDREADKYVDQLVRAAQAELAKNPGKDAYKVVAQHLCPEATDLLKKTVELKPGKYTFKAVIEQLQAASGVQIIYPFGKRGTLKNYNLSDDIEVTVPPEWSGKTLGDVLALLDDVHKFGKFKWVTCTVLPRTIFVSEPIAMAPVRTGDTGLVELTKIKSNDILSQASIGESQTGIDQILMSAEPFQKPGAAKNAKPLISVGSDFSTAMRVEETLSGKLLWRLVEAVPSQPAETMSLEIKDKVAADWKTMQAYNKALELANSLAAKVKDDPKSIEAQAKAAGMPIQNTGLISRYLQFVNPYTRRPETHAMYVPFVGSSEAFIKEAFELAPADPEPPYSDAPVKVIALPAEKKVLLAQRVDYEPVTRQRFDEGIQGVLSSELSQRWLYGLVAWVNHKAILDRTGFKGEGKGVAPAQQGPSPVEED